MQIKQRSFKVSVFAFIILLSLGVFIVRSTAFSCWDFRNNLWGPAYLLTHHQSPYRVDKLFDLGNAVWMPMAIGLFFPLGFLSLQQASNLWFVFNLIWFLLILWISSGSRRPSTILFAIVVLLSFLFPPTVTHLWSGQITILTTLTLMIAAIWHDEMPVLWPALLIAVSLVKPQLAILAVPGLLAYRIKEYGLQKAVELIFYLIGCLLIITTPLFLGYPNWIPDFIWALQQNPVWAQPSSLYSLRSSLPNVGTIVWLMLTVAIFATNIRLWTTLPARDAMYWSLALTLLVTPYVWTWDFVMILPLFISHLFTAKTKISRGMLLGGYVVCWGLITSMKIRDEVNDSLFWWIPWLLLAVILAGRHLNIRLSHGLDPAQVPHINEQNSKGLVRLDHVEKRR